MAEIWTPNAQKTSCSKKAINKPHRAYHAVGFFFGGPTLARYFEELSSLSSFSSER